MDSAKNLLEGCDLVEVKDIGSNGTFIWISKLPCPKLVFTRRDLEVSFELDRKSSDKTELEKFVPQVGKRCAVCQNDDVWVRGEVIAVNNGQCRVLLIDQGKRVFVPAESVLPLSKEVEEIPALAFRISFYGVQPVCMQFEDHLALKFAKKECEIWQPFHLRFLKDTFDQAKKIYYKEITNLNRTSCGLVIVNKSDKLVVLNNELCEQGLAIKVDKFDGIKFSENVGRLAETSREYLLRAAFGTKAHKTSIRAPENSGIDESDITLNENEATIKLSIPQNNDINESGDEVCNSNNVPQNHSGDKSDGNLIVTAKSKESILSDSTSEGYDSAPEINSASERNNHHEPNNGKPMSAHVLKLYEESYKIQNQKRYMSTTSDSNEETDDERKNILKNSCTKQFFTGGLLHQSPTIVDEIEPSERLIDGEVGENILEVLELRHKKDVTQLQMHAYPVLTKCHNLIMVSAPHSGKTLASVVGVLTLLNETRNYEGLPKGAGPKAIFITSFSQNVQSIEKMCRILLSKQRDLVVKTAYGGDAVEKKKFDLAAGCDILVTTPRCLVRLLRLRFIINIERLCHLVLDDGDFIFDHFLPEIQELIKLVTLLENKRKPESKFKKIQKIVSSERWFPVLKEFVKDVVKEGFICIPMSNLLEAAVYSCVRPNIQFLKPENKCSALIDLLKGECGTLRSVIVAKNEQETLELQIKLDPICGRLLVAHEGMNHVEVASVKRAWAEEVEGVHAVIICTDHVVFELAITNADNLIHYSLPDSKTKFGDRFVFLLEKYNNIFEKQSLPSCKVHIFVDEENDEQFPEIFNLMERLKFPISDKLHNVVKRINLQKETLKKDEKLCESLKQFGTCWKMRKCHYRHIILPKVDDVPGFPKAGYVKVKVLYIHDASRLSVLLLEHRVGSDWKALPGVDQSAIISLKMENYFSDEGNRFLHDKPKIGDLVAVEDGGFRRARVIEIIKFDDKKKPIAVKVKFLETGKEDDFKAYDLYSLPDNLKKDPPQAVDIYLCNLQPTDLDKYWSYSADKLISSWLIEAAKAIENYSDTNYLCGKIVLSIGRNLWLDPLTHSEWLSATKAEVYHCSFAHDLIKQNLAVEKPDHLEMLYKLCKSAGLKVSIPTGSSSRTVQSSSKGQWAHLNRDEFTEVSLVFAKSPEQLFLKLPKFEDRLDILQKDINKLGKMQSLKKGDLIIGDLCLAMYPKDKTWNRAKVIGLPSEDKVEVFYADHGDFEVLSWDELVKVPVEIIQRLPFQAIECRLAGVQPIHENGWSDSSVSLLYGLSEVEEGLWKILSAYVVDLELKAQITDGRKYSVVLLYEEQDSITVLNKELVIQAEANWRMEEKAWLDTICDKYMKINEPNQNDETVQPEEDWDKCEVNNNDNCVALNKSLSTTFEPQHDCSSPSSIVDEQLKRLYDTVLDDSNIEISDASAVLKSILNIPVMKTETDNDKTLESSPVKKPAALDLPKVRSINSSSDEAKSSTLKKKLALFSLPKRKPALEQSLSKIVPTESLSSRINKALSSDNVSVEKSIAINEIKSVENKKFTKKRSKRNSKEFLTTGSNADLSDLEDSVSEDGPPPLKLVGNCHTPPVFWYQNFEYIWIHIKLIDVRKYFIEWTYRTICFSTWLEEKYYRLDFNLFGPIYPETLQHSAKGFFVQIKMRKVLAGAIWSRLLQSKARYNWLKVNPEHVFGMSDESDDETRGKRKFVGGIDESQIFLAPRPPGLSDSDSEFSSDVADFKDMEDDPDDPFNVSAPAESD